MRKKPAVYQVLPGFNTRDAICNEVLLIRDFFRSRGFKSEVYVDVLRSNHEKSFQLHKYASFRPNHDDIILYHFSVYDRVARSIPNMKGKWILRYHNITPAKFFHRWDSHMSEMLDNGRKLLPELKDRCVHYIADSEFNKAELETYGIQNITILPLIFPLNNMTIDDKEWTQKLSGPKVNILFTGRIAPNKKQDDIVKAFYHYHRNLNPDSRLILAGSFDIENCNYCAYLCNLIRHLNLEDAVFMPGKIDDAKLISLYKTADLFLSMSEHEGFCIPVVESMKYSIPVLAYKSTAVPYTLGSGGILFSEKDFSAVAEMMHYIIRNRALKEMIADNQKKMMKKYSNDTNLEKLNQIMHEYIK